MSVFETDFIVHHVSFVDWWFIVRSKPRNDCRLQESRKSFIVATLAGQYESVACSNLEEVEEKFVVFFLFCFFVHFMAVCVQSCG